MHNLTARHGKVLSAPTCRDLPEIYIGGCGQLGVVSNVRDEASCQKRDLGQKALTFKAARAYGLTTNSGNSKECFFNILANEGSAKLEGPISTEVLLAEC